MRKFASDHLWINEFLHNSKYSMFVKSWTLFKYLGVDDNQVRFHMSVNHIKPWNDLVNYDGWVYYEFYASPIHDQMLTIEEKEKQWYIYLDFWYNECFNHEYIFIKQVELIDGYFDIGVFCKKKISLNIVGKNVWGFLESIDKITFEKLSDQHHPSLFVDSRHVDTNDSSFTPMVKYYIVFGLISCVNSDNCGVYFSNRHVENAFGDLLKWNVNFHHDTIVERYEDDNGEEEDLVLTSYAVEYDLDVEEVMEDMDEENAVVGVTLIVRANEPHPITMHFSLSKIDYFYRLYFGCWRGLNMINYEYEAFSEIRINYDYKV